MGFFKSKGEKIFFVLFFACLCTGAGLLVMVFVFQMGNANVGSIAISGAKQAKRSNGRIFVRWDAGGTGYAVFDNVTFAKLAEKSRSEGWSSYSYIAPVGDLVYSTSGMPNRGTVELWDGTQTVAANASVEFQSAATCVCVQGNYAYFGISNKCVAIIDVTGAPSSLTFINATPNMAGVSLNKIMVFGGYVFACGAEGMAVCNVANPANLGTPQKILGPLNDFAINHVPSLN